MQETTLTGSYIGLAGLVVAILGHFNIIIGQDSVVAVIAGGFALYGIIHQIWQHKTGQSPVGSFLNSKK